jgi:predicted Ser/Thr protein kinase
MMRYGRRVGSDREQELARTITAAASSTPADPAMPLGATLGRYRLERELGAGAMGVVHAAFDPDLERRIALKVLKGVTAAAEARNRLLREARAMARLSHPNVVTVHEVGTAGGRDFVAMELIHGESLAEWLRADRRPPAAILDAFFAAGRGLAAAHAAGIVHRDFKPHNVLRSRDGRIVVTDFGLAREAHDAPSAALDATLPAGAMSTSPGGSSSSSLLAGLTVTGSLLGTPAYMAPEQWSGGVVTPATDQFAYCVALWEALAGMRPYPGPTLDDLRAQVARGPAALDASPIPRRVRGILRRGLDPDPARRWPSMEALLARLVRVQRRPGIALAIAAGALGGIAALTLALRGGDAPVALCDPPAREVATVWSPAIRARLQATTSDAHVAVLDTAYWGWRAARGAACGAPPQVRQRQLDCLDGVLGRFDALRQAFAQVPGAAAEEIQAQLVDPAICRKPAAADVPRLTLGPTPAVIEAYAFYARHARSQTEARPGDPKILGLAELPAADPCARAIAALAVDDASRDGARQSTMMSRAISSVDQCGDDRLRADLLIRSAWDLHNHSISGDQMDAAIRQAEIAANRVMQPELAAAVAALHRIQARRRNDWDERFRLVDREIADYRARGLLMRQLKAVITRNDLRMERIDPGDLDMVRADVRLWRPIAVAQHWTELAWQLDFSDAHVRLHQGELARAHADLVRLWQTRPPSGQPASGRAIAGEVVDDRGRPVAGATVAAGIRLFADSIGIGLPVNDDNLRIATTDASGRFELHDVALGGPIAAQLGDRRSRPEASADHLRLVLAPTRSVSGKVDLGGVSHTRVSVYAYPIDGARVLSYTLAPVAADGSFSISGVTRGGVFLTVTIEGRDTLGERGDYRRLPASPGPVVDVALAIRPAPRSLDIVVRSSVAAAIDAAAAWVLPGHWEIKNIGDLLRSPVLGQGEFHPQQVGDSVPPALADKVHHDDLLQHVERVPDGELTVCASSFPGNLDAAAERRVMAHLSDLVVTCKYPGPGDQLIVLAVPPQQRFE